MLQGAKLFSSSCTINHHEKVKKAYLKFKLFLFIFYTNTNKIKDRTKTVCNSCFINVTIRYSIQVSSASVGLQFLSLQHQSWLILAFLCKPLVHDCHCKPHTHTSQNFHNPATNRKLQKMSERGKARESERAERVQRLTGPTASPFSVNHGTN